MLGPEDEFLHDYALLVSQFDGRVAAVVAGGFLLGHGDHIGSAAMQYLPPSSAYMCYAGLTMGLGTLLNELIEPVASPGRLLVGVALVFLGIGSLGMRVMAVRDEDDTAHLPAFETDSLPTPLLDPSVDATVAGEDSKGADSPSHRRTKGCVRQGAKHT